MADPELEAIRAQRMSEMQGKMVIFMLLFIIPFSVPNLKFVGTRTTETTRAPARRDETLDSFTNHGSKRKG